MGSDQRRRAIDRLRQRRAGLGEEDVRGEAGEGDGGVDVAESVEQRRPEAAEAEAAAEAGDRLRRVAALVVAVDDPAQAFGGDFGRDRLVHLHEDEAAVAVVLLVEVEHGVARGAGAGEGIEDQGVL